MDYKKDFKKITYQVKLFRKLFKKIERKYIFSYFFLTLIGRILEVLSLSIFLSLFFVEKKTSQFSWITRLETNYALLLIIIIVIFRGIALFYIKINRESLRINFSNTLKNKLLPEFLYAPNQLLIKLDRINITESLNSYIDSSCSSFNQFNKFIESLISTIIYISGAIYFGNITVLPLLLGIFGTFLSAIIIKNNSWELGKIKLKFNCEVSKIISEATFGIKTIRLSNSQEWIIDKYKNVNKNLLIIQRELLRRESFYSMLKDFIIISFLFIWFLFYKGEYEKTYVLFLILLTYKASGFINSIITSYRLSVSNLVGFEKLLNIREILDQEKSLKKEKYTQLIPNIKDFEIINYFEWNTQNKLLNRLSKIKLRKGDILIIKGDSGIGKSTFMDLLSGNIDENSSFWKIESDNNFINLKSLEGARDIKKLIGYCPQNPYLFESTLFENLVLKNNLKDKERKILSTKIEEFLLLTGISQRFKNFSINEMMNLTLDNFSGGEKKRLSLIRTWLRDCPIEFLDEPTESLDSENSLKIKKIILKRSSQKITIIATHDESLSTLSTINLNFNNLKNINLKTLYL